MRGAFPELRIVFWSLPLQSKTDVFQAPAPAILRRLCSALMAPKVTKPFWGGVKGGVTGKEVRSISYVQHAARCRRIYIYTKIVYAVYMTCLLDRDAMLFHRFIDLKLSIPKVRWGWSMAHSSTACPRCFGNDGTAFCLSVSRGMYHLAGAQ